MQRIATVLLSLATAGWAEAGTLAYWRLGDDSNSLFDSSGNSHTLTRNGGVEDAALPYAGSTVSFRGAGAKYSNPIPQTKAANTKAVMNFSSSHLYVADPFTVTNFTVEAYFTAFTNKNSTQYLVSQLTTDNNQRSWALGIASSSGTSPARTNEFYALLSPTGTASTVVPLGLIVTAGVDYYIAFTYDAGSTVGNVVLRYKDLTHGGPLQTATTTFGQGVLRDSTAPLRIGSYNGNNSNLPGLIDEVRISDGLLRDADLLITPALPRETVIAVR